jgi:signal transduction histidine kinase
MVAVDYATLEEYLRKIMTYKELSYLVVLDRNSEPVIRLGETPTEELPSLDQHPALVDDGNYDIAEAITVASQPMGRVLMGFSLGLMENAIRESRIRGISIAAAEIVLTVTVTILIGLGLTRRLGILSAAAVQVGKGNYQVHIPVEAADEVGMTAAAFNRMVTEVSSRSQQLKAAEEGARALLAENRKLIQKSLTVQEDERKHLARELHDELGQCITAIQADAESIRDLSRQGDERIEASSAAILEVSARIYAVVHSMMQSLRPGVLDDLGLVEALKDEVAAWQERNPDTEYTLVVSGNLADLGERTNITVYRIVQECLTNIAKHAHAAHAAIHIAAQGDHLVLEINDDGLGIVVSNTGGGLGLVGIRERVEGLGGMIKLVSEPGSGTAFTITIPVQV